MALPIIALAEAGNKEAGEIANNAGFELAGLVTRTEKIIGAKSARVIFSGGVANAGTLIKKSLEFEIGRGIEKFSGETAFVS